MLPKANTIHTFPISTCIITLAVKPIFPFRNSPPERERKRERERGMVSYVSLVLYVVHGLTLSW